MKITFDDKDLSQIVSRIKTAMGDRKLGELVSFAVEQKDVVVTISKLGTSTLRFDSKVNGDKTELNLTSEKIAFAHKAFKDEVKEKIVRVIQQAGGKIKA